MDDKLRALVADAFREVPAIEANRAIARARLERAARLAALDPDAEIAPAADAAAEGVAALPDDAPLARSYELVLTSWENFASTQLPRLVYHLESIGARPPGCGGVLVAAFAADRLFLLDAAALLRRACALLGVTPEQLLERHGTGERRTAMSAPLVLPGTDGAE